MSITNQPTTDEPTAELSETAAREITDKIKASLDVTWQLIAEAYRERAHAVLGYSSWDAYVSTEFGGGPLWVPRGTRPEVAGSLRASGMSWRAIATAMGVTERTVRRDLDDATAANAAVEMPATVKGLDGRDQPAQRKPRPKPTAPPASPQDEAAKFRLSAEKLLLAARALERLHLHARGGKDLQLGVAAVRQAVETLHKIAATQERAA
jgi:predicted transcriptional regulator